MQQISVNMPDDLLAWVQAAAERDVRPLALQIRFYIAEAMRAEEAALRGGAVTTRRADLPGHPSSINDNPPLPTGEQALRAELAQLEPELTKLEEAQRREGWKFLPQHEAELRRIRDRVTSLRQQLAPYQKGNSHD